MLNKTLVSIALLGTLAISSCATIVGEKTQLINISSSPDKATITITDEKGQSIFKGETPTPVTLQKSDGTYFGGKSYNVVISKDNYTPVTVKITSSANGWYIGGNFMFGGLIGWLIVDPLNGAMYNLSPEQISQELSEETSSKSVLSEESISIVLLHDVPTELQNKMVKIN